MHPAGVFARLRQVERVLTDACWWRKGPGRLARWLRSFRPVRLPLRPLAPAVVIVSGLAVAVVITLLGLADLIRASDQATAAKAAVLAETLALRARAVPSEYRAAFLAQAASRAGADVMLVTQAGEILLDAPVADTANLDPTHVATDVVTKASGAVVPSASREAGVSSGAGLSAVNASSPAGPAASASMSVLTFGDDAGVRGVAGEAVAEESSPMKAEGQREELGAAAVREVRVRRVEAEGGAKITSLLASGSGFVTRAGVRWGYAARQLAAPEGHLAVVVFVDAPARPPGARALVGSVAALALVLLSMAALASYTFSKTADDDLRFLRERIGKMAQESATRVTELVPIRTFDQVGVMTSAFNMLVERFAAAERAYEQDLAEADVLDRSRAQFLAALSHELRTPLNAILGFADLMLAEVEGPLTPSAREDLEVIRSSGEHLRALIDDILDLSAMETGKLRLERTRVDLSVLAEQVVREAAPLVVGRPIDLRVETEAGVVAVVDRRRLRQVLANLVGNAAKFTQRGSVTVRVRRVGVWAVIEVADTGPGVPETARASIFEEYAQAGDVASRRKGTGLGLAIARRLTEMHAGRLSLASEVGRGSTFKVELPLRDDDTSVEGTRPLPSPRGPAP